LIGRLRRRLPGAPVLVGMWAEGDPVLSEPAMQATVGADIYVQSLRHAVQACVDEAKASDKARPGALPLDPAGDRGPEAEPLALPYRLP
jgi:hypothetical protein